MSIVQRREFSVQVSASSLQSLASRVQRPEPNVQSPASRVQRPESRVQRLESRIQSPEFRVQRPESGVQSPASRAPRPTLASRAQEFRYVILCRFDCMQIWKWEYQCWIYKPNLKITIHIDISPKEPEPYLADKENTVCRAVSWNICNMGGPTKVN